MDERKTISIIIPCYNEQENIGLCIDNCLQALDHYGLKGELICVNDASTDNTEDIISSWIRVDRRVNLVNHTKSLGFGGSFWQGVDLSSYEYLVVIPGDNENDPWEIMRYVGLLEHVDVVIPFVFNSNVRPFFRRFLSKIYRSIINITFASNFNYTNGTVLYRRELLQELGFRNSSFFFQTDIIIRLVKKGYLFAEVPYRLGLASDKVSKAVSFPSLLEVSIGYVNLVWFIYFKNDNKGLISGSPSSNRQNSS